jgi:hypothetical protein
MKITIAQLNPIVGNIKGNLKKVGDKKNLRAKNIVIACHMNPDGGAIRPLKNYLERIVS